MFLRLLSLWIFQAQRAGESSRQIRREMEQGTWGRTSKGLALNLKTELFGGSEHEEAPAKEPENE